MKKIVLVAALAALSAAAGAQNITMVNGKPVAKARVDALLKQVTESGQQVTPDIETRAKDAVVLGEIFLQEADKKGIPQQAAFQTQLAQLRQNLIINTLFENFRKANPITDAEARAEFEKYKAANAGDEVRAHHILVEDEAKAKDLIAKIKLGAKFEDLAKANSKDPGSAEKGGDLDFANPKGYVPEFGAALAKLKKGEMTQEPVKSQFGFHVIRLDEVRAVTFPGFDEVKAQVVQGLERQKLGAFQAELRSKAKTDYKFAN